MTESKPTKSRLLSNFPFQHLRWALSVGLLLTLVIFWSPPQQPGSISSPEPLSSEVSQTHAEPPANQDRLSNNSINNAPPPLTHSKSDALSSPPKEIALPWVKVKVKSGDSLSALFIANGFTAQDIYKVMQATPKNKALTRLSPGQYIEFQSSTNKQLNALKHHLSEIEFFQYQKQEGKFVQSHHVRDYQRKTRFSEATIDQSLFLAAQKAGMSDLLTMDLANIFGWDIDFALDIRSGDRFEVLYEELYLDGKKIKDGKILAAHFTNRNKEHTALRYTDAKGNTDYYTPDGRSLRKEFLRSPVGFARVSSRFNLRRKHPILHKIRAHKGVDYAASRGTPVKSTGDGKVIWAGKKGGYGRVVIIQHGQKYSTLYAHLKNYGRGIRSGKKIRQGQVIGYIGSSGMATGPHLHYEFRVNGVHKNPLTVKLPRVLPIAKTQQSEFESATQPLLQKLALYQNARTIALLDDR
ncbi:MAG: peptidase M23 [Gammaproteobacteria bacterium]|nr:MAG: peptidase M23 [Gammaproteobacteria bacterium]